MLSISVKNGCVSAASLNANALLYVWPVLSASAGDPDDGRHAAAEALSN
jgi:hypothetical protein